MERPSTTEDLAERSDAAAEADPRRSRSRAATRPRADPDPRRLTPNRWRREAPSEEVTERVGENRWRRETSGLEPNRWRAGAATEPLTSGRGERPAQRVLDRYRLERRLGAGGFGVVWLAFDEKLEREVAVKVIEHDGNEPVPARAEREARVAARLNHPGIVALYELAADEGSVYLVSELVPGRSLAELERAGALSDRDVGRIGVALCDALAHAHRRDVIHRDVKPQNVIVVAEPAAGAGFAKLADFGVAHLASGDPLTRTGDIVGTLAYMAPEQAEGERVTFAADVYALALTLYECWSGTNPVRANGPVATVRRLGTVLPPLGSSRRDLPAALCDAIDAALDPAPERRPPLASLRAALEAAVEELSDRGGLVEPGTLERVGLPSAPAERRRALAPPPRPMPPLGLPGGRPLRLPHALRGRLAARVGAGLAAGSLATGALAWFASHPAVSPVAVGAAVAVAVALLPRLAWLAAAAVLAAWVAAAVGLHGTALLMLAAAAAVPLLLPRAGPLWSLPALAPLLGAIGLAPAFIALSGFASTTARRAGLAAAGFVWLVLAEAQTGSRLLFGAPAATPPHAQWQHSLGAAATHALAPLATSVALAPLLVWAAGAALLPLLVRGRGLVVDSLGAAAWAVAVLAAQHAVVTALAGSGDLAHSRGVVAGVIAGAVLAVAVTATGAGARAQDPPAVP